MQTIMEPPGLGTKTGRLHKGQCDSSVTPNYNIFFTSFSFTSPWESTVAGLRNRCVTQLLPMKA